MRYFIIFLIMGSVAMAQYGEQGGYAISSGGSGGGNAKVRSAILTPGVDTVLFSSPMANTNYIVTGLWAKDANGNIVDVPPPALLAKGLILTMPNGATVYYRVENSQ